MCDMSAVAVPLRRRTRVPVVFCTHRFPLPAFTLVELLVVIGIMGVLIAMLLPALISAQRSARTIQCASNIRSICAALLAYAGENRGAFPPNISIPSPGQYWYDQDRIGRYLANIDSPRGVLACPEDIDGRRSYAMNVWASSRVDEWLDDRITQYGPRWSAGIHQSSRMILLTEKFSDIHESVNGWWSAPATVGARGETPAQRFGAAGGVSPPMSSPRWGYLTCELPYARHRVARGPALTEPAGQVNIGYADGHVATRSEWQLADFQAGRSTLDSLWNIQDFDRND